MRCLFQLKKNLNDFIVILFVLYFNISFAMANGVAKEWVAIGSGDTIEAFDIVADNSGNVYVTGYDHSYTDIYVTIKYDPNGNEVWHERYYGPGGATSGDNVATEIALDSSGNVYVSGESDAYNSAYTDFLTIKYDTNGNQKWIKRYDEPGNHHDSLADLALDRSGNVFVAGASVIDTESYNYTTVKYDPNGIMLWSAHYNGPGNYRDFVKEIVVDDTGNVYLTGTSEGDGTEEDFATIKYDPNGNEMWVRRYNGPMDQDDIPYGIALDSSSNVYVIGRTVSTDWDKDFITIKYDRNGNQKWIAYYNGPLSNHDIAVDIAVDDSDNIYVAGYSRGIDLDHDYVTIKYDPNGNQMWASIYDGLFNYKKIAKAMAIDNSGNVYVTGTSEENNLTEPDILTIKYDTNGKLVWVDYFNGAYDHKDTPNAIIVDNSGKVYVTGTSYEYVINPGYYGSRFATIKYAQCGDNDHPYPTGDFSQNCFVNLADFAIFALAWLTEDGQGGWNPDCNLYDLDLIIDISDLGIFAEHFLEYIAVE